jgi:Ring finger domain
MDRERIARIRWIRINRRFQLVISCVAFLFSFILFAILVCWVFLTSAYVLSIDKICAIPLKRYYWLVTLQLVLDVFRSDIMRFVFRWDARSNERVPGRVVFYNIAYLIYALLVLRHGIKHVYYANEQDMSCRSTAPDIFKVSTAFVSLSIAAWAVIILGYLVPFCIVAAMLTLNGYNPNTATVLSDGSSVGGTVFPAAYATTGAPPGCVDQLAVVSSATDGGSVDGSAIDIAAVVLPGECCICMEAFRAQDVVVETPCRHMFHKSCCREWLRQARTCPVCRDDIPSALEHDDIVDPQHSETGLTAMNNGSTEPTSIPIGPSGRPVANMLRLLRQAADRFSTDQTNSNSTSIPGTTAGSGLEPTTPSTVPVTARMRPYDLETGRSHRSS